MTTRARERKSSDARDIADLAPVDLAASAQRLEVLPELVQSIGATLPLERPALATRINEVLIAMRAPGHEAEESELLLELLTTKVLNDQLDTEGRSCRKEIVETLMACGFPHALQLEPDDVRFLRTWREQHPRPSAEARDDDPLEPWELSMRTDRRVGAVVMIAAQLVSASLILPALATVDAIKTMVAAGLLFLGGVIAGVVLAARRPSTLNIATFGVFVTMLAIAGGVLTIGLANWDAAIGPGGLALGLYVSIMRGLRARADRPRPGDWDFYSDA